MSADGRDVFFTTQEKLVGQDIPGIPSIYDAREGGGIPDPPAKEPCHGDACQGQGSAPPTLPDPASTSPIGDGNAGPQPSRQCAKGKRKVRSKGKVRCVKLNAKGHGSKHHRARSGKGGRR
jgi:hypothetical protein